MNYLWLFIHCLFQYESNPLKGFLWFLLLHFWTYMCVVFFKRRLWSDKVLGLLWNCEGEMRGGDQQDIKTLKKGGWSRKCKTLKRGIKKMLRFKASSPPPPSIYEHSLRWTIQLLMILQGETWTLYIIEILFQTKNVMVHVYDTENRIHEAFIWAYVILDWKQLFGFIITL